MSGTVSHLVGGEAHAAQRVQVQVLLLPPRSGVPGDRSSSLGWTVALGMWEAHPVRGGTYLRGHARSTRAAIASFELERTANGEAIRPESGGSREG